MMLNRVLILLSCLGFATACVGDRDSDETPDMGTDAADGLDASTDTQTDQSQADQSQDDQSQADQTSDGTDDTQDTADTTMPVDGLSVFMANGFVPSAAGIAGADMYCNQHEDAVPAATYKAFLASETRQICDSPDCANGPAPLDWVLAPSEDYVNLDGVLVFSTDENALINFPMTAEIETGQNFFSGFALDWTLRPIHCENWTSTMGEAPVGWSSSIEDTAFLAGGTLDCDRGRILCIEQSN